MSKYAKDTDGIIHAVNPHYNEYTLCGNAYDGDASANEDSSWRYINKSAVTCKNCIAILKGVKNIKYKGEK